MESGEWKMSDDKHCPDIEQVQNEKRSYTLP